MNGAKPTYVVDADKLLSSNPKELWAYRELYLFLVKRDFVAAYKQTVLGPLFFFVQPFLASIVFLIVFGQIARFAYRRAAVARVLHLGHHRVELFSQLLESGIVHFSREWRPLREDLIPSTGDSAEPDQHERSEFRYSIAGAICGNCLYQLSGRRIEIGLKVLVLPAILLALLALDLGCLIVSATVKYRDLNIVVGCTGVSSSIPGQPVRSVGNPCGAESDDEPDWMLVCPSQAAADEMFDWLTKTEPKRIETLPLGFLDSGVDVDSVSLAGGLSAKAGAVSAKSSSDLEAKESAIARCRAGKRWYRFWLDPLDAKGATTRASENFVFSGKWQWSRN